MNDGDAFSWPCSAGARLRAGDSGRRLVLASAERPGRDQRRGALAAAIAGYALVALALGMLWRLFRYEAVDFSLMLVLVGAISGAIWGPIRHSSRAAPARWRRAPARPRTGSANPSRLNMRARSSRSFFSSW